MRLILTILLIGLFKADAQIVINASAPYIPVGGNLILDLYPNAEGAFSLRKLRTLYTGSAIRIRKDTVGQPEQDINFLSNGNLDTNAIKSFLNARSGFVVTWYDQSGNGRNKTNATQSAQPRIALNGVLDRHGGDVCIVFQNNQNLISSTSYTTTHNIQVAKVNAQQVLNYSYNNANNGFFWNGSFSGVNGLGGFDGTNIRSTTGEDLNQHIGWFSQRSGNLYIARDGGAETNTGSFAASINLDRIGGRASGSATFFNGIFFEAISWNNDISANKSNIETNINNYYSIY